jgi:hypothetical protein
MSRVLAPVEAGSRLPAVRVMDTDALYVRHADPASRHFFIKQESYWHLPALAVIERKAFWPLIFAEPTKQPIRVLSPYRELVFDNGVPPSLANLLAAEDGNVKLSQPFLQDWQAHYDYVLVLEAGDMRDPAGFDREHLEFLAGFVYLLWHALPPIPAPNIQIVDLAGLGADTARAALLTRRERVGLVMLDPDRVTGIPTGWTELAALSLAGAPPRIAFYAAQSADRAALWQLLHDFSATLPAGVRLALNPAPGG